mgnify:CR=1|jgi:hypothetical protein|tara:strand:+ start:1609 stop:2208 length:600 start_codon:yes stop_codon:yes gene_type:complete
MEEYNPEAVEAFAKAGRPIPGQSLTSNPDEPRPFEGPPDFTNFKEALDYTAAELLLEENYTPMVLAMGDGIPVTDLAMQIGYVGFREGKWNPDLMMMLMEPLMYLLMALAEKADIQYRIDDEDDDDDEDSILEDRVKNISETLKAKERGKIPEGALPSDIVEKIKTLEMPKESLLEKPQEAVMEEEVVQPQQSLLSKGQ